jgi:hypothetical protein
VVKSEIRDLRNWESLDKGDEDQSWSNSAARPTVIQHREAVIHIQCQEQEKIRGHCDILEKSARKKFEFP